MCVCVCGGEGGRGGVRTRGNSRSNCVHLKAVPYFLQSRKCSKVGCCFVSCTLTRAFILSRMCEIDECAEEGKRGKKNRGGRENPTKGGGGGGEKIQQRTWYVLCLVEQLSF